MKRSLRSISLMAVVLLAAMPSYAQMKKDTPIEVSSDTLDVLQAEHKAIFTGNVIAVQGSTNMRAAKMTVYYRDSDSKEPAPAAAAATPPAQGIYRIDAEGNVVFTTPTETAMGNTAIYNVDADTIDVVGGNVTLTRGQNILKGSKLSYNMTTGRSVLTGGTAVENASGSKPARVHGLFVPKSAPAKPASKP